MGKICVSLDKH